MPRNRFSKHKTQLGALKSRIIELREIPARNILGAPWNWRVHGEDQQEAVASSLADLGFYDPLKVFQTSDMPSECYMLIDGHGRQELISDRIGPDTLIPCIITDMDEIEAKRANLTHDSLGSMATPDKEKLDTLLRVFETESVEMANMLEALAKDAGCDWAKESVGKEVGGNEPIPEKFNILIECKSEAQHASMLERLAQEAAQAGFEVKSLIS